MGTFLAIILITSAKFLRANGNNAPLFRTNCYFEICAWPRSHLACLPGLWMIARRKEEGAGWQGFAQFRLSQRTVYGTGGHCFMIAPAAGNTYQDGQLQNTYQENPVGGKEIHRTVPWRRTVHLRRKHPSKVMPHTLPKVMPCTYNTSVHRDICRGGGDYMQNNHHQLQWQTLSWEHRKLDP